MYTPMTVRRTIQGRLPDLVSNNPEERVVLQSVSLPSHIHRSGLVTGVRTYGGGGSWCPSQRGARYIAVGQVVLVPSLEHLVVARVP